MCEYHEEVYKEIDSEIITLIEKFSPQLHEIIDLIGSKIGHHIITGVAKLNEDGSFERMPGEIPEPMTKMINAAGLLYIASWLAAESSPSEDFDDLLSNVFANGLNDGNAYMCHNKSKGN
jgi:hypothetical protein